MKTLIAIFALVIAAYPQSSVQGSATSTGALTTEISSLPPVTPTAENLYCTSAETWIGPTTDGNAVLPTACVYTALSGSPSPGSTIDAANSGAFTTALTNVTCGDTITLHAGVVYAGSFTIPAKGCGAANWITIRTDATTNPSFPPEGTRATPCEIGLSTIASYPSFTCVTPGSRMAIIESNTAGTQSALDFAAGADHYRFIGIAVRKQPGSSALDRKLVNLSAGTDHIIFDRSLCYGESWKSEANDESQGCFNINNSTYFAFVNGWAYDTYCMGQTCQDSAVFAGGVGTTATGPVKVYNSLIATGGESLLMGGGGNFPAATPAATDIEFRSNHSFKPLSWMLEVAGDGTSSALHPVNKNLFELKNGNRVLIEGNVLENNWAGWQTDQTGNAILLGPKNQNNKVSFTANITGTSVVDSGGAAIFAQDMVSLPLGCTPPGTAPNYCGCPVDPSDGVRRCVFDNGTATFRISAVSADLKTLTLTTAPGNATSVASNACHPGDAPDAFIQNVAARYNWIRNTTNGFQIATGVSSVCLDEANGNSFLNIHDNVFDGLEDTMSNGNNPNLQSRAFDVGNGVYGSPIHDLTLNHNTATILHAGAASVSGLMKDGDSTNVAIMHNFTVLNNVSAGGIATVQGSGTRITGSPLTGLNQHHCVSHANTYTAGGTVPAGSLPDPNPVGNPPETNCTWNVEGNIVGTNQWLQQQDQTPANYPALNQLCGLANATCFLSGSGYGSIFQSFNSGYLGNYRIAPASPYKFQASGGLDPGADIDQVALKTTGVAPLPAPVSLNITTITLPAGSVGSAYTPTTIAASGNSPFKACSVTTGSLPAGITLSRGCRVGWLGIFNVSRTANVASITAPEDIISGAFVPGQTITISGLVNGSGSAANDASLNGTFTLLSSTAGGTFTFNQTAADIAAHGLNYVGPTIAFAPTATGTASFTVSARDGAKQSATQALSISVTGLRADLTWTASPAAGVTYRVYRSTTSNTYGAALATGLATLSYTDSTISSGTTYFYVIRAFDGTTESTNSNEVQAVVP